MPSDYKLTHHQISYIQSHASLLADLPEPSTEWHRDNLPPYLQAEFQRYREIGIVHRIDTTGARQAWKTDEDAWRAIQEHRPDESVLPCGHSGFTNKGTDNEFPYECNACGRRFKREAIRLDS